MEPDAMTMTARWAPASSPERLPVILDTDVGGEPDDAMSLVIAARELPELALVVTSDELSGQRARFARFLLDSVGRPDVPVVAGRQLSATPCFLAAGLTPEWVGRQLDDVPRAVAAACGRAGGVARWIGLGPLSNLAAVLGPEPALARKLFITQLAGTLNRGEGRAALPPRNFRLDPSAGRLVLASACYLRLVSVDAAFRRAAEITAASPVFTALAGGAATPWAAVLAAHCRQFFSRYHPAVVPASPLALSAALGLPFTSFAPAAVTVDGAGQIAERYSGDDILFGRDHDDVAFARWLRARLRPVTWAAHRPPGQAWVPVPG
jgi:pyrimidine-specific ribonucleoside hydrolase